MQKNENKKTKTKKKPNKQTKKHILRKWLIFYVPIVSKDK